MNNRISVIFNVMNDIISVIFNVMNDRISVIFNVMNDRISVIFMYELFNLIQELKNTNFVCNYEYFNSQ